MMPGGVGNCPNKFFTCAACQWSGASPNVGNHTIDDTGTIWNLQGWYAHFAMNLWAKELWVSST